MGWNSAGDIFDPVAQALIDAGASAVLKRAVLTVLIDKLRDGDWDTEDESLYEFRHDPAIVSAFYTAMDGIELDGCDIEGRITYDADSVEWVMECSACGALGRGHAELHDVEWASDNHNRLIRQWFRHDEEVHSGDGQVLMRYLIGGDA